MKLKDRFGTHACNGGAASPLHDYCVYVLPALSQVLREPSFISGV